MIQKAMQKRPQPTTFASAKIAHDIASRNGEAPRPVQIKRLAQRDVNHFVDEILSAQKSSRKAVMALD